MAEIEVFMLQSEAIEMLHRFAIERKAKGLSIDKGTVRSCESGSEHFRTITNYLGDFFFIVSDNVVVDHLHTLSPRNEDWLTVSLGSEFKEEGKPSIITLSDFRFKASGIGLKFKRWFGKYARLTDIRAGVHGTIPPAKNGYFYSDIYYTNRAKKIHEEHGIWKQNRYDNAIFYPSEPSVIEP
ncbi:MAG: hypothetical protein H7145_24145 [Akkermansiaceae bacterium]|nr:hypothetical protein [Armatimonadota bacterium]